MRYRGVGNELRHVQAINVASAAVRWRVSRYRDSGRCAGNRGRHQRLRAWHRRRGRCRRRSNAPRHAGFAVRAGGRCAAARTCVWGVCRGARCGSCAAAAAGARRRPTAAVLA